MNSKILVLAISLKIVSIEKVLLWSDSNIEDGNIDDLFIDLSSIASKNKNDIIGVLNEYGKEIDIDEFNQFHRLYLSYLYPNIVNWSEVQIKLINYHNLLRDYFPKDEYEFWSRLKGDFQLRKDGFSGCMKRPEELKEYFLKYNIDKCINNLFEEIVKIERDNESKL